MKELDAEDIRVLWKWFAELAKTQNTRGKRVRDLQKYETEYPRLKEFLSSDLCHYTRNVIDLGPPENIAWRSQEMS